MKKKDKYCHYSGLPSPAAYEQKPSKMKLINKYYPVGIAFICLLYSVVPLNLFNILPSIALKIALFFSLFEINLLFIFGIFLNLHSRKSSILYNKSFMDQYKLCQQFTITSSFQNINFTIQWPM